MKRLVLMIQAPGAGEVKEGAGNRYVRLGESRFSPQIPAELRAELAGPDRRFHAIRILLRVPSSFVAAILPACPVECHRVEARPSC